MARPVKSSLAPLGSPVQTDHLDATRPSLRRLTSNNLVLASLQDEPRNDVRRSLDQLGPWTRSPEQRQALLHDVAKGDSLAGIAIQYGIAVRSERLM